MCIDCGIECKCSCPSEEIVFSIEKGIQCGTCLHHLSTPRKSGKGGFLDDFIHAFDDVQDNSHRGEYEGQARP